MTPNNTVPTWNGFVSGEVVKVQGERGTFKFRSARLDDNGECLWVTVIGGIPGHSQFRHFAPSRISKPKERRQRGTK
jgi:hypothetical protein